MVEGNGVGEVGMGMVGVEWVEVEGGGVDESVDGFGSGVNGGDVGMRRDYLEDEVVRGVLRSVDEGGQGL